MTFEPILSGVIIGATAGLVTSAVLGVFHRIRKARDSIQEIMVARLTVVYYFTQIVKAVENPDIGYSLNEARYTYFTLCLKRLDIHASYAMPSVSHQRRAALFQVLESLPLVVKRIGFGEDNFPDTTLVYEIAYQEFKKLAWLNLPSLPPWPEND